MDPLSLLASARKAKQGRSAFLFVCLVVVVVSVNLGSQTQACFGSVFWWSYHHIPIILFKKIQ